MYDIKTQIPQDVHLLHLEVGTETKRVNNNSFIKKNKYAWKDEAISGPKIPIKLHK